MVDELFKEFQKLQEILSRLKDNVNEKLGEKEEIIVHLENKVQNLHEELQKAQEENQRLQREIEKVRAGGAS
ncbi:hypothetical protein Ddc_02289 [Ditylenchus destructor]|nr:hypothetical protein Ddc_02289 [Ditylenchus destructor]